MTAEYRTVQKIREALEREYALLSYRLPYMSESGYSQEQEEVFESASEQSEEEYKLKAVYPLGEYEEFDVYARVRLVWYSLGAGRA